jgi:hypothetical protein
MHLAVAKLYVQKNPAEITNEREFFNGSIAPDLTDDKAKTHYSLPPSGTDLISNIQNKVNINELYKLPIDNDFQKGVFLHLLTDYMFYKYYFSAEFLQNTTHAEYSANLYASYNFTNDWLERNYQIKKGDTIYDEQMARSIANLQTNRPEILMTGKNILNDTERLAKFLDFVAGMNLQGIKDAQDIGIVNF